MTRLEITGWKIRKLFPGSLGQQNSYGASRNEADAAVVRLIASPRRLPATRIEQRLVSALKKTGSVSIAGLVNAVAAGLYAEELRNGAAALDIGLFGSRLFHSDIIRALKAEDGVLWEIRHERKNV
jgi:hypothetical protein